MSDTDSTVTGIRGREVATSVPSEGYVLVWDQASLKWTPKAVSTLQSRTVASDAPADGDVLTWEGASSSWKPVALPQPLGAWVGSVNTQSKVLQRVPWTCSTTGPTAVSTGVAIELPSNTALFVSSYGVFRDPTSVQGVFVQESLLTVANNGGVLTTPQYTNVSSCFSGDFSAGNPAFRLSVGGTTATLQVAFYTAEALVEVDCQGYVDLMLI
jgi:hypothetical protein